MTVRKSRRRIWPFLLLAAGVALILLPLKSVARPADTVDIFHVEQYYKGAQREDISAALKLDDLEVSLQLYNTSIFPTVSGGSRRVSATYYEVTGQLNGRPFTITADDTSAVLFFHGQSRGYRLQNGHTLAGMIHAVRREVAGTGA